ncbi:MAG TPA: hydantoinase/oxoprolinase family protein [Solirubrobacteraceae bacterium]|jgi:N-methylhydantoinase A|nr:hydantoinase/oxoprolinase family protein [Solirubrobacteraceae bacterium]
MLLGVDVGGTFTDAVLAVESGAVYTAKVPSTPGEQSRGVLEAVRAVLAKAETPSAESSPAGTPPAGTPPVTAPPARAQDVERFAHGMTVATNALLEFSEAHPPTRTALIATDGFTDIVELGRQARAHLYRLCQPHPAPLAPAELRFGAPERMTPEGPLRTLDPARARALVEELARHGPQAVAVALLHSYAHPEHERLLGELLAELLPDIHVSLSHELVGTFREYERAATTEVDAALSPLLASYLRRLRADAHALGLPAPAIMQSSGGLLDAEGAAAHAALTVLSGPAGGVRGALLLAELAGEPNVLCFDMGGTSCDVCLIEHGRVAETAAGVVAGRPLALAMLDIHTVGAGGGSIAWRDPGGALRVGPHSAGAYPGPACYGRGGKLPTVTDANLLLGRLPAASPLAGGLRLDPHAAERAIATLAEPLGLTTPRCAEGIVQVAEAEMLRALRAMTVERGIDPRSFALMPFGGAGPLHAAALARALGMRRILCPRASGVLCALGLAAAAPRRDAARTVMLAGDSLTPERLAHERAALLERARADLRAPTAQVLVRYDLRYRGQSFELTLAEEDLPPHHANEDGEQPDNHHLMPRAGPQPPHPDALRESFAHAHLQRYGYRDDGLEVELVTIRASALGANPTLSLTSAHTELPPGTAIDGPTICSLPESTLFVPPGWSGEVDTHGTLRLHDHGAPLDSGGPQ